jgi:hypothetical protein
MKSDVDHFVDRSGETVTERIRHALDVDRDAYVIVI